MNIEIKFNSVKEMALSHISAYVAEQADGIYPGYGSKSQLIGEHFISRCILDTKENRRLNKKVLNEYK
tara:strand:+ start:555 stop:758 length:204 start_codon:yes stop_codon:yes gene_type:complete